MEEYTIAIPSGVDVKVDERKITASGKKGKIEKDFDDPRFNHFLDIAVEDGKVIVRYDDEKRKVRSMAGTINSHITNMIEGAANGYTYTMKIIYTHFPITVSVDKSKVSIRNFFGEKGSRDTKIVGDTQVRVDKESITLTGADLEAVSQTAANIERACRLSKRDRRIFQDGIYIDKKGVA